MESLSFLHASGILSPASENANMDGCKEVGVKCWWHCGLYLCVDSIGSAYPVWQHSIEQRYKYHLGVNHDHARAVRRIRVAFKCKPHLHYLLYTRAEDLNDLKNQNDFLAMWHDTEGAWSHQLSPGLPQQFR